jgi:hypothetical protein
MSESTFAKQSPAHLFLELWAAAEAFSPHILLDPGATVDPRFPIKLNAALSRDDPFAAAEAAYQLIYTNGDGTVRAPEVIVAIQVIDQLFLRIHPRAVVALTTRDGRNIPAWLKVLRRDRRKQAYYARKDGRQLIARGPLMRTNRTAYASSGASLADSVASLAVVSLDLQHEGRPIQVIHSIIDNSLDEGVARLKGTSTGSESVLCVPILEKFSELCCAERVSASNTFVRYSPHETVNSADRILQSLEAHGQPVDIVVAPELVMSSQQVVALSDGLGLRRTQRMTSLVLAGSGNVEQAGESLPFNEMSVLNAIGAVLWKQRKLWTAGVNPVRAGKFGVATDASGPIFEDNCCAAQVQVVDADELGRCIVLICQDVQSDPLVLELIRQYQPDWVFVPILDRDIGSGNWIHQRAWALSAISPARFVVANSAALYEEQDPPPESVCALMVGPARDDEFERAHATLRASRSQSPMRTHIQWRNAKDDRWQQTTVGSTAPKIS